MHNPIVWITAANVIYLASYSVREILWLRILTVAAAALLVPYYLLQAAPLRVAVAWSFVFIAINGYWIVRLLIERRPVHLTADEARLRQLSFASLSPREARDLYALGSWDDLKADISLTTHDHENYRFSVILSGDCDVMYCGTKISQLGEGQFVGTIDLQADALGDFDVFTRTATRVMCWPRDRLKSFLVQRPDVALALRRSVGFEVERLLDATLTKLSVS